jgi:hypothetical protein
MKNKFIFSLVGIALTFSTIAAADDTNANLAPVSAAALASSVQLQAPDWMSHLQFSGYVQPQLLLQFNNAAAGGNTVVPTSIGSTTNGDFFRFRRDRLKTEYVFDNDAGRLVFEIEPISSVGTIARNIEAVGTAHWASGFKTDFAAGMFKVPFGFEVLQSDADRPFIERSWGEQNLTPGEFDTGARAYSSLGPVKLQLAAVNGNMVGMPSFTVLPDLNHGKDFYGRLAVNVCDFATLGVSGTYGQGMVQSTTATRDYNRGGFNGEVGLHYPLLGTDVGQTKVFSEVTVGQNMDKGVHYAFALPSLTGGSDQTELNVMVRVEQDLSKWATLGLRYDRYTTNVALSNNNRETYGAVAAVHFNKNLQLMTEYDHATDRMHASGSAAPDKQINTLSTVLQARF